MFPPLFLRDRAYGWRPVWGGDRERSRTLGLRSRGTDRATLASSFLCFYLRLMLSFLLLVVVSLYVACVFSLVCSLFVSVSVFLFVVLSELLGAGARALPVGRARVRATGVLRSIAQADALVSLTLAQAAALKTALVPPQALSGTPKSLLNGATDAHSGSVLAAPPPGDKPQRGIEVGTPVVEGKFQSAGRSPGPLCGGSAAGCPSTAVDGRAAAAFGSPQTAGRSATDPRGFCFRPMKPAPLFLAMPHAQAYTEVVTAPVLIDVTPPRCECYADGHGLAVEGVPDLYWQLTLQMLTVSLNCSDPESGLTVFEYAVGDPENEESVRPFRTARTKYGTWPYRIRSRRALSPRATHCPLWKAAHSASVTGTRGLVKGLHASKGTGPPSYVCLCRCSGHCTVLRFVSGHVRPPEGGSRAPAWPGL